MRYIQPQEQTKIEEVKIKNLGDSDAQVKYSITSARILNDYIKTTIRYLC